MPTTDDFFDEQEEQSRVKSEIVVAYFGAWASIMATQSRRIGYVDLYSGPGRYLDGEPSTPLLILEKAIAHQNKRVPQRLVSVFADENAEYIDTLQLEIGRLPGIDSLAFKPEIHIRAVDQSLVSEFASVNSIPALTFLDPWGYRGLSSNLIMSVTRDFGCEAIFFFNYNRINAALSNQNVEPRMIEIFGAGVLERLRADIAQWPQRREELIMRSLGQSVRDTDDRYLIPFRFQGKRRRASHYICFVTKHPLGLLIMKDVMATHGAVDADGVPKFQYMPTSRGHQMAFETERPIRELPGSLRAAYSGRRLSVEQICSQHHAGTPFRKRNYKTVLIKMESQGLITCEPERAERRSGELGDRVIVTFPA